MIDELIGKVAAAIHDAIANAFGGFFNFIPEIFYWYWWLFVLFLICGVIIWFFGWSKIVRMVASIGFLFAAVFVAGGAVMARRLKAREDAARPKVKPKPPASKPPETPGWTWPWGS
jgi:hypothetical protein